MFDPWQGTPIDSTDLWRCAQQEKVQDLARAMARPTWAQAVTWLQGYLAPGVQAQIRECVAVRNPDWPVAYHLGWGMSLRNALREHGFGEDAMGVRNLDNIYIALVEEASCSPPSLVAAQREQELGLAVLALKVLGIGLALLLCAALWLSW